MAITPYMIGLLDYIGFTNADLQEILSESENEALASKISQFLEYYVENSPDPFPLREVYLFNCPVCNYKYSVVTGTDVDGIKHLTCMDCRSEALLRNNTIFKLENQS